MAFQAVITDLNGVARQFIGDYESFKVTRRLGEYSEFVVELDVREAAVGEVLIAERALKLYDGGDLRFFGQVWEPLEINEGRIVITARDPFAGLQWRRVREETNYTAQDAGAIAYDRLAVQNSYRDTFLAGQASIDRSATLTDDSAVVSISPTNDLRAGMGVDGLFGVFDGASRRILSVDSPTQITLDGGVNILSGAKDSIATAASPTFNVSDSTDLAIGMTVTGTFITPGSVVIDIPDNQTVVLNAGATGSGATSLTFSAPAVQTLTFTENASVDRTVTYPAGKREDEIIKELSAMADGFFFRVDPLDDTPGKMGTLRVLYPDAGTSRSEVRFGYGAATVDNLTGFKLVNMLPLTRMTVASQDADGGRIAAAAENTAASQQFGLFEDEQSYTDVDDTTLLQASADAGIKPTPPLTLELTPGPNAPLLFTDFDVGDFVRLHIVHGQVSVLTWVRVAEATMRVDKQGVAVLDSVTVETLSGARPNQDPAKLFRSQIDANRRRLEALERRVQEITTTAAAAPPPPDDSSSGGGGSTAPPPDDTPPPPPPPAPDRVPGVAMSQAFGFWDDRGRGAHFDGAFTPFDSTTGVSFIVRSDNGGQPGDVVKITPTRTFGASNNLQAISEETLGGLSSGARYWVAINAANSAGQATSGYISFTIPTIQAF